MSASEDFSKMRAEFRREIRDDEWPRRTADWMVLLWAVVMVLVVGAVTTVAVLAS